MSDSEESEIMSDGGETGPDYPPWLEKIDKSPADRHVKVLDRLSDDQSLPGYVRCTAIEIPDAADFADGLTGDALQLYTLRRYTTVLVTASETEPPYIGLIHKIWLRKDPEAVGPDTYSIANFVVECYWFYRQSEVPPTAWQGELRHVKTIRGATCRYSPRHKPRTEAMSERQLLFSSHHTRHDSETGWVHLDAVLQTCRMHWVGFDRGPPERYFINGGHLVRVREPGFVVQGFLWCKGKAAGYSRQFSADQKRAYKFDGDWGDKETMDIVKRMCRAYDKHAAQLQQHNRCIIDKYQHLKGQAGGMPSDDGEGIEQQQQQKEQQQPAVVERQQWQQEQKQQQPLPRWQQLPPQRQPLQDKQQHSYQQQQQKGLKPRLKGSPQQQQQQQQHEMEAGPPQAAQIVLPSGVQQQAQEPLVHDPMLDDW